MAVYAFWGNGDWLKIGQAGSRSQPRFTSQHYHLTSNSTLAKSLSQDQACRDWLEFDPSLPGDWIKSQCHRVNIYMGDHHPKALLSFLEVFLHLRLKPRYEG